VLVEAASYLNQNQSCEFSARMRACPIFHVGCGCAAVSPLQCSLRWRVRVPKRRFRYPPLACSGSMWMRRPSCTENEIGTCWCVSLAAGTERDRNGYGRGLLPLYFFRNILTVRRVPVCTMCVQNIKNRILVFLR
jgi:hypothetical protein